MKVLMLIMQKVTIIIDSATFDDLLYNKLNKFVK